MLRMTTMKHVGLSNQAPIGDGPVLRLSLSEAN